MATWQGPVPKGAWGRPRGGGQHLNSSRSSRGSHILKACRVPGTAAPFPDDETEAQRGTVTRLESQSSWKAGLGFQPVNASSASGLSRHVDHPRPVSVVRCPCLRLSEP